MIEKLNNNDPDNAERIYSVFQDSYAIEAKILAVLDFPPLKRSIIDIQKSTTSFYGFCKDDFLMGVIEIEKLEKSTGICSLVVDPKFFRQGIANKLLKFAENLYNSETITVETGLANEPAIRLYQNSGFEVQNKWITTSGIPKISFVKVKAL